MRTLGPAKRFLLLPVSEKAGLVRVNLKHGGTLIDAVYARLCPPEEQDYAEVIRTQSFADEGLTLAVSVESCPDTEGGVSAVVDMLPEDIKALLRPYRLAKVGD